MTTRIGNLRYDPKKIIGRGRFGTVFSGFHYTESFIDEWIGRKLGRKVEKPIAVKRIQRTDVLAGEESGIHREVEVMLRANDHPNILRLICTEIDANFL